MLNDGRVLLIGNSLFGSSNIAELYDPSTGTWSRTGDILLNRYSAKLVKLQDGKVLMIGGDQWGNTVAECEIYNPEIGQWTQTGSLNYARASTGAVTLSDDKIFVAGGDNQGTPVIPSEIYDPATGSWSVDASLNEGHNPSQMTMLLDGNILIAGGYGSTVSTNKAELYLLTMPNPIPTTVPTIIPTATPSPSTAILSPTADSYIKQGSGNENEGASTFLRVQSSGKNRALITFDESQIAAAVGISQNYTAKIQLTITDNGNNWGTTGRTIAIHRLTKSWTEGNGFIDGRIHSNRGVSSGVTWNCAIDTNIHNQNDDCSGNTAWNMSNDSKLPFVAAVTASRTITNNQNGIVEFDVTSDIQSYLTGSNQNYGWIIKKIDEGANGRIQFGSKESVNSPKLIITPN